MPAKDGHPSQYQPTVSAAAGIELTTIESQVRRHNRQTTVGLHNNNSNNEYIYIEQSSDALNVYTSLHSSVLLIS